jgi:hypothetical protein
MTTNNAVNNDLSNPIVRTGIKDSNGNTILSFVPQVSAVNYVATANAATAGLPVIAAVGSDTNVSLTVKGQGTGQVAILGTGTNDSASAGYVGEYVSSNIPNASATSLSNGTAKNVTSISLTAGDWDIFGNIFFSGIGITNPSYYAWTSITSATLPDNSLLSYSSTVIAVTAIAAGLTCPFLRVSIASTTTVYLSAQANFSAGTATACGSIFARRRR